MGRCEPERGCWYWAIYEHRVEIILAANDNSGFFAAGQEELWPWGEARIIKQITKPTEPEIAASNDQDQAHSEARPRSTEEA